jgi:PPK2 family polyphosphate:nucleotide phosphotransferase
MQRRLLTRAQSLDLRELPTDSDGGMDRAKALVRFAELSAELSALQELMYAAGTHSVLLVLQGRDTAGKDGTIKAIADTMNSIGLRVASFKVPTPDELAHDFLWRVHREAPGKGQFAFFNRSHYEDVLVVRVHQLVPDPIWKRRYDDINAFEKLLTDSGTILLKVFLHISADEQKRRLLDREREPGKAWKLNPGDWEERRHWEAVTDAYNDALGRCATEHAPWLIVPADHKWYRNVVVAEALVDTLNPYKAAWRTALDLLGKQRRAALDALGDRTRL